MKTSSFLPILLAVGCGAGTGAPNHATNDDNVPSNDPNFGQLGGGCNQTSDCSSGGQPACCSLPSWPGSDAFIGGGIDGPTAFTVETNSSISIVAFYPGRCVDLSSDPMNSGACNKTALGNTTCLPHSTFPCPFAPGGDCLPETDGTGAFTGNWVCLPEDNAAYHGCHSSLTGSCPSGLDCWGLPPLDQGSSVGTDSLPGADAYPASYCGQSCATDADCGGGCCQPGVCKNQYTSCAGIGVCQPAGSCTCGAAAPVAAGPLNTFAEGFSCSSSDPASCSPIYVTTAGGCCAGGSGTSGPCCTPSGTQSAYGTTADDCCSRKANSGGICCAATGQVASDPSNCCSGQYQQGSANGTCA